MPLPRALIVYESMFGGTHRVADAVAEGLEDRYSVSLVSVGDAPTTVVADLLVVGAPTHVSSLSTSATRAEAGEWSREPDRHLVLDVGARGIGVREWLDDLDQATVSFAAFDTRANAARFMTGSAAKHIDRRLRKLGAREVAEPMSFLVHENSLLEGELGRARAWGGLLGASDREPRGQRV